MPFSSRSPSPRRSGLTSPSSASPPPPPPPPFPRPVVKLLLWRLHERRGPDPPVLCPPPPPPPPRPVVVAEIQHAFGCVKPFGRAPLADGRWHIFNFARMLRYDEAEPGAATAAALAWYDEAGGGFFPPGKAHLEVEPSDGRAIGEDEAVGIVRRWTSDTAVVTGAERCVASGMRVFRDKERELGNAKLGWYGASPADVKMASETLFWLSNWNLVGERCAHGRGLHLLPLRSPYLR